MQIEIYFYEKRIPFIIYYHVKKKHAYIGLKWINTYIPTFEELKWFKMTLKVYNKPASRKLSNKV